jgi:hypothetical protein
VTRQNACGLLALCGLIPALLLGQEPGGVRYTDITGASGIDFTHNSGARGQKYLPETMGPGAAFIDYDQDGWVDLFLVNGTDWPGAGPGTSSSRLYRNQGDGSFTDATLRAGLDTRFYGLGTAVADYDNDGDPDLFVTALGPNHLYRNDGDGTFTEVTAASGIPALDEFSTGAAWSDYDRDGNVDLFVVNYVRWSIADDLYCTLDGTSKSYCTPESYEGASMRLYRNMGAGRFEDVTETSGLYEPTAKGLGIAVFDYDQDDWPDVMLVNDTEPNRLYRNRGDGTFTEVGLLAGIAYDEGGVARAGMGVDTADYDRSGYPSVAIGNFSNEMISLYHNEGVGLFIDDAPRSEVGRNSLLTLSFACLFLDYDLDGWLDLLVANGHIEEGFERIQSSTRYAQPPHLFRNLEGQGFREVTAQLGDAFGSPRVARAAAYADIDHDGDLDILMTTNGGSPVLFRADGGTHRSLRVELTGTESNRDGLGARVAVTALGETQTQTLRSGAGYLSQSEMVLTFGLGSLDRVDRIEVRWPSGTVDTVTGIDAHRLVTIEEGRGLAGNTALAPRR